MEDVMSLFIEKETSDSFDFDYEEILKQVIDFSLNYMEFPYETEINVVLTDNEGICQVNKEFRNIDKPTDVLSFPMLEYEYPADFNSINEEDDSLFNPETGELLLGDIMISTEKIKEQAHEYGHSNIRELAFLTVHSMLHLFGYDHIQEDERIIMEEKQREIMDGLQIYR